MPYIHLNERPKFDKVIEQLPDMTMAGELNYVIFSICLRFLRFNGVRYTIFNAIIGVLGCVIQEFYRRMVGPYEDQAIERNGDLPCQLPQRKSKAKTE